MDCKNCPNNKQLYFKCNPVLQMDLFAFSGDYEECSANPDEVIEFIKIMCGKK